MAFLAFDKSCFPTSLFVACGHQMSCGIADFLTHKEGGCRAPQVSIVIPVLSSKSLLDAGGRSGRSSVCVCESLSRVQLLATLWTVARQAPLSMGFSRQEYWSGLPLGVSPSPTRMGKLRVVCGARAELTVSGAMCSP